MVLGPFTLSDVRRLQEALEAGGATAELVPDPSVGHQAREESKRRALTSHPTYQGIGAHLYLDIPDEHLQLVSQDLINMGIMYKPVEPILGEDYLCTQCDYHSLQQGLCPKHHTRLVDFSTWNASRKSKSDRRGSYVGLVLLLAFIAFLVSYAFYGRSWR